jgi:alkylhydroperoxidase family enzyme
LALLLVNERGRISDETLASARSAGLSDAEIIEIVANVALNVLTNFANNLAETEIDFPVVELAEAA